jgi:hypothetical protein
MQVDFIFTVDHILERIRNKLIYTALYNVAVKLHGQFMYKLSFLLSRRYSCVKQNSFAGSYGGDTYNRYNVSLRVFVLFVSSDHDKWFLRLLRSAILLNF